MHRFVMAALMAATLPGPAAAQAMFFPADSDTQRVSTQGMGEVTVPAGRATALFVLQSEGGDVADVAATTATLRDAAIVALQGLGLGPSSYALVSFGAAPAPGPMQNRAPGQPTPPRMQESKAALRVVVDPPDRLDEVVAAVLGAGAESVINVTFDPDERPEARREAARIALAQARTEAEALAEAAGMRLGRLAQIFSMPDYMRQNLASTLIRGSIGQGVPLTPSDLTVRVTVQATWELVPR